MKGLIFAMLLVTTCDASALSYDCPTIVYYVRLYGHAAAIAYARSQGYSLADINRVRRTCFSK